MSKQLSPSSVRFLVAVMIGASLALIALAVSMIVNDEGSPVFVAVAGSMLAAFASVIAAQAKKTR